MTSFLRLLIFAAMIAGLHLATGLHDWVLFAMIFLTGGILLAGIVVLPYGAWLVWQMIDAWTAPLNPRRRAEHFKRGGWDRNGWY